MTKIITGEEIFRCQGNSIAIAPTTGGYTLNYSIDGKTWTAWGEAVPAGEPCIVGGVVPTMYFKLAGNNGDVEVIA